MDRESNRLTKTHMAVFESALGDRDMAVQRRLTAVSELDSGPWVRRTCVSLLVSVALFFNALVCVATAQPQSGPLDEILVTRERPGPAMWRVSNGTHDLWILATLLPLPKHMTWRSHAVENTIAVSQVVLAPPEIMADIDFFGNPIYAHSLVQAQTIRDHESLKQIIPNDIYVRWQAVKNQYLGSTYNEHTRPLLEKTIERVEPSSTPNCGRGNHRPCVVDSNITRDHWVAAQDRGLPCANHCGPPVAAYPRPRWREVRVSA
jgi:hypothetical protein